MDQGLQLTRFFVPDVHILLKEGSPVQGQGRVDSKLPVTKARDWLLCWQQVTAAAAFPGLALT